MFRRACLFAALVVSAVAAESNPPATPAIQVHDFPAPGGSSTIGPSLTAAPDGTLWLTWLEAVTSPTSGTALRFARLEAGADQWSPAQTIASGPNWFVNQADFPALTVGEKGQATAVWFINNPVTTSAAAAHDHHGPGYHALISRTTDGGKTWSAGVPLTRDSDSVEFVSLATLADGRLLAAWLDGRAKKTGGKAMQVYARIIGAEGPDTLVDASVCDCCQTTLTAFPDGTALLAYRGRNDEEVRDMRIARFRGREWEDPRPLNNDDWRINACPVNGPRLASDGGRVAAAWFTAADKTPRVLASFSPDAGARFLMPLRIDGGQPAGRVDTLLLHDGAMLVTWLDVDGTFWLRRVTPEFTASEPVRLATKAVAARGFPRLALRRDYTGGKTVAELIAVFATTGTGGMRALRVTVPEGDLLESDKGCGCGPTAEQLQGFPIRGTIEAANAGAGTVRARHFELPGIFADGTREFKTDPATLAAAETGRQFLGRVERRDGAWWLFDVRVIGGPIRSP